MTAPPMNGEGHEAIRKVEQASARARQVELGLVAVTCLAAVIALMFSAVAANRSRHLGEVIADCTTRGGRCYEENRTSGLDYRQAVLTRLDALQAKLLDATNCITEQLAEHRQANETAHELEAQQHGYAYGPPPGTIPPPIPGELKAVCIPFIPPSQGGTK